MAIMQTRSLSTPEEIRTLPKTTVEVITFGEVSLMKPTFQPDWRWSERVKPTAWTERCEGPHFHLCISGRLHVRMDVGTESEIGPGDAQLLPSWHDARVVGEEPSIGWTFRGHLYARLPQEQERGGAGVGTPPRLPSPHPGRQAGCCICAFTMSRYP